LDAPPAGRTGTPPSLSWQVMPILVLCADSLELCAHSGHCACVHIEALAVPSARFIAADLEDEVGEFGVLNDLGEDEGLHGLHGDRGLVPARQLADPAQAPPHCRVEVVLYGVVSSEWRVIYLPSKSLEISFHLLPCLPCASNSTSSSCLLQASWLIAGLRWLCHLGIEGVTSRGIAYRYVRWCCPR
jgi:hypothetical protein